MSRRSVPCLNFQSRELNDPPFGAEKVSNYQIAGVTHTDRRMVLVCRNLNYHRRKRAVGLYY